jgi:hypothetical protein
MRRRARMLRLMQDYKNKRNKYGIMDDCKIQRPT